MRHNNNNNNNMRTEIIIIIFFLYIIKGVRRAQDTAVATAAAHAFAAHRVLCVYAYIYIHCCCHRTVHLPRVVINAWAAVAGGVEARFPDFQTIIAGNRRRTNDPQTRVRPPPLPVSLAAAVGAHSATSLYVLLRRCYDS